MKKIWLLILLFICISCSSGGSNIIKATRDLDFKQVRIFINNGANINDKDSNGFTPLIIAAYYGNAPIVKYLCENGASINEQEKNGFTALIYASYYGFDDVVQILLQHNASLEIANKYGYTALSYAEKNNDQDIIDMLKAAGAKSIL